MCQPAAKLQELEVCCRSASHCGHSQFWSILFNACASLKNCQGASLVPFGLRYLLRLAVRPTRRRTLVPGRRTQLQLLLGFQLAVRWLRLVDSTPSFRKLLTTALILVSKLFQLYRLWWHTVSSLVLVQRVTSDPRFALYARSLCRKTSS